MAPSLYTSHHTRSYISLHPLNTRDLVRDKTEDQEEREVEEEQVQREKESEDQQAPRRHPRTNLRRAPSQANMHHTTVPQAILPSQLGSRNVSVTQPATVHLISPLD